MAELVKAFRIESEGNDGFILTQDDTEVPQAVALMMYGEIEDCEVGSNEISVSVVEMEKEKFDKLMLEEWQP